MKKQFLIFATIATVVIVSCSKKKIEAPGTNQPEEIASAMAGVNKGKGNTLDAGLLCRFEFDGNLNDKTGQVSPGVSTVGRVLYTADRKGEPNKALRFNGAYGVTISEVPLDTNRSISVWVKKDVVVLGIVTPIVEGMNSFTLAQDKPMYMAGYYNDAAGTSQYVLSPAMDNNWHHLAATRDNNTLRFYIDGNFVGSSPTPAGTVFPPVSDWLLAWGYNAGYVYWKGNIDELRLYDRVLTAAEISKLSNF